MNKILKHFSRLGCLAVLGSAVASCANETPFGYGEGEGEVRLDVTVNRAVTRATPDNDAELRAGCTVYISNQTGLLHKWKGTQNLPDRLYLRYGQYTAEAWAGDSVGASFDSKFYKGYQKFQVAQNQTVTQVALACGLANVVASVDATTVDPAMMRDYTVTIGHSRASLDFTAANADVAKGYFMMPNADKALTYTIAGVNSEGNHFSKTGSIPDVQPAHEYRLKFTYNPQQTGEGGAFITVTIDDTEVEVADEVEILGAPTFLGFEFDLQKQIVANPGEFTDKVVRIGAFNGLKQLEMTVADASVMGLPSNSVDFIEASDEGLADYRNAGVAFERVPVKNDLHQYYITFSRQWLNSLPASETEYVVNLRGLDNNGRTRTASLRVANTEMAVVYEDPVLIDTEAMKADLLAVRGTTATVPLKVVDDAAGTPGVRYRQAGTTEWTTVMATATTRAGNVEVRLTGLTPATSYEICAVAGEFVSDITTLTTETAFAIPNASMEDWSNWNDNSKVVIPAAAGIRSFWDSGNHGSVTMNVTLTQGSDEMVGSGSKSARLRSQFVGIGSIGKFAAGNLFVGEYVETVGTDGKIDFGRPYNGSHPDALRFKANYRPGTAVAKKGAGSYVPEGAADEAQIYVALTTGPVRVFTKTSELKLFNKDDAAVLAYGQVTWTEAFGPDGSLAEVTIPLEYKPSAHKTAATHLVIVCSASKYGDYFQGGEGSLMYIDDFELVY